MHLFCWSTICRELQLFSIVDKNKTNKQKKQLCCSIQVPNVKSYALRVLMLLFLHEIFILTGGFSKCSGSADIVFSVMGPDAVVLQGPSLFRTAGERALFKTFDLSVFFNELDCFFNVK